MNMHRATLSHFVHISRRGHLWAVYNSARGMYAVA